MTNKKVNEELKEMSIYVYCDGNGNIPKGWDFVRVDSNKKTGYYAETYKKGNEIAIAYRGSDINWKKGIFEAGKDISNDTKMLGMLKPEQLADAKNTYNEVKKSYPNSKIVLTGHSLGGSLSQMVSAETGTKAVTFNAFGTGKILSQNGFSKAEQRLLNITNYGNPKDIIFMTNKDHQPGTSYITNTNLNPDKTYTYKQEEPDWENWKEKMPSFEQHKAKNLKNLDKAAKVEIPDTNQKPTLLHGGISYTEDNTLAQNHNFSDVIREKWRNLRQGRNARLQNRTSKSKKTNASGTTNGKWITINGNHVLVEK